ncbi:MAG: glycosyltransferase family 87 protein [Rhodoglobus sp.]
MRIVVTAVLLAASAVATALSVGALPYYNDKSGELEPLAVITAGLWLLFGLSLFTLRGVKGRAAVVLVLAGSVAIGGAAMFGPPNTSTDSARYAWDGIVQNAGYSPYDYPPVDDELEDLRPEWLFPAAVENADGEWVCEGSRIMTVKLNESGDILCTAINRGKVTTIYPPASELVFAGVRLLTGPSPQYWPLQLVGLLLSLGTTVLLLRALAQRGRDVRWAALWGWCPLVATEAVTNSHIDVLGAVLLLGATLLASTKRPWLAGFAVGAAISVKLIPVIGAVALLRRNPVKVILGAVAVFALLYVPYVLASGIGVLGYLPGYLSEEGYVSGTRFILVSLVAPGPAALVISAVLLALLALVVWWKANPDDPWLAQLVMIGGTLLIVSPRYPWYALLLVPMIAMTGRWEWLLVPLALTERLLFPNVVAARITVAVAIVVVVIVSLRRAGPGAVGRAWQELRHPFTNRRTPEIRGSEPENVTER